MELKLKNIEKPNFGMPMQKPEVSKNVYEERCKKLYEKSPHDWLVIYGDKEHFGNIFYLTGFDPRFEETLFLIGPSGKKFLLVGNEGLEYSSKLKVQAHVLLCQSFSLMGQDRSKSPRLDNLLRELGINESNSIGICGWKYLEDEEKPDDTELIFVPSMILKHIENVVNTTLIDITPLLMHPEKGLRVYNEVEEIALLEYGASHSSLAVQNIVQGTKVGISEYEAVSNMNYSGDPLSTHVMFSSSKNKIVGLESPGPNIISKGDGVTTAVGFFGGLSCRAGKITDYDENFLNNIAKPYFKGICTWYENAYIGAKGKDLFEKVSRSLMEGNLKPALNPGHLTSIDEWLHSLVSPNSQESIKSGMAMQVDIIPEPLPDGTAVNCEDSVVFADKALREQIEIQYPDMWKRIKRRQKFLREQVGINIDDSLLPLSSNPGYFSPFWLSPKNILIKIS